MEERGGERSRLAGVRNADEAEAIEGGGRGGCWEREREESRGRRVGGWE